MLEFIMQRFEADNGIAVGLAVALKFSGESIPIWVDMQVCVCVFWLSLGTWILFLGSFW